MATQTTPAQQNPTILIKEITDQYVRKNFQNIADYFSKQNQLLNFKFFEISTSAEVDSATLAHGLGILPKDIIVLFVSGAGQITFDLDNSDLQNLAYSTTDAVYCRIMVGSYWGNQSSNAAPGKMTVPSAPPITSITYKPPNIIRLTSTGGGTYNKSDPSVLYLRIKMCGGGGGGGPAYSVGPVGIAGKASIFGNNLLVANGGGTTGNVNGFGNGVGGTATVTAPAIQVTAIIGGNGTNPGQPGGGTFVTGGNGGMTPFFGGGGSGTNSGFSNGVVNTGGGGSGGGTNGGSGQAGNGGGSGAYLEAIIPNPADSYTWVVGAGGAGAVGGINGGAGADGIIIIEEHFQ